MDTAPDFARLIAESTDNPQPVPLGVAERLLGRWISHADIILDTVAILDSGAVVITPAAWRRLLIKAESQSRRGF